jgi:hypothetical protein
VRIGSSASRQGAVSRCTGLDAPGSGHKQSAHTDKMLPSIALLSDTGTEKAVQGVNTRENDDINFDTLK